MLNANRLFGKPTARHRRLSGLESPDVEKTSMDYNKKFKRGQCTSDSVSSLTSNQFTRMWPSARRSSTLFVVALCLWAKNLMHTISLLDADSSLSGFRERPRMVQIVGRNVARLSLESSPRHLIQDRRNHNWIDHGADWHYPLDEREEGCVSLAVWQDDHHQSCLRIHETSLSELNSGDQELVRVVGDGHYRSVWMVREFDGTRRVLKTLRYDDEMKFTERWIEKHRIDAVALEQLTASPHVADIHGYCATAALADYADGGNLSKFIKLENRTKSESLKVAYHVAAAVADAHHPDSMGRATIAHTDIKPDQFILLDGVYKLNDFNRARFISWNPIQNKQCGFHFSDNLGKYRAPEELRYDPETEKIDVFTLGLVLYRILTRKHVYAGMKKYKTKVKHGFVMNVTDPEILNSTHLFDTTLLKAVNLCWTFDPEERPRSREIADLLHEALEHLAESESRP